ncbi:MAG: glucose 1-dehydrogenase [Thiohalomonadaceae bacterium]
MSKLAGKVALVTGAADGIGAAAAETLAREGAAVVITDINLEGAQALADKIGGSAVALRHDVCDEQAWRKVMEEVKSRFGHLDILVNNAGGSGSGTVEDTTPGKFSDVIRLNLESVYIGCQLAVELMKGRGGSIINISSIHGIKAAAHAVAYTAAKGGVRLLTKSVALHCAQNGYKVRCNSVHPGYILTTQMNKWVDEQEDSAALMAELVSKHPIGFLGAPEDIAKGILYLASDDSRFVTGSELVIDGGFSL